MIGRLPRSLDVRGTKYEINTDYRDILRVIQAFNDDELKDAEKIYICLRRIYKAFDSMPPDDYEEAYKAAIRFIECERPSEKKQSKPIVSWEQDEQIMFPAINKAAGCEVRLLDYCHWFTFMGYFQSISSEDTYGYILMLRQKKAKRKKLEKHEQEFWNNNRELCVIANTEKSAAKAEDALRELYESLRKGG